MARKHFPDAVVRLPREGIAAGLGALVEAAAPEAIAAPLTLHFALGPDAAATAALEKQVARGNTLTPAEVAAIYAPDPADVRALTDWLAANGFHIEHAADDGIYASAAADRIATALDVQMVQVTRDGITRMAARDAPSLPAAVARAVSNIGGLQPFLRAYRHSRLRLPSRDRGSDGAESGVAPNEPPYLVGEILKAYNADGLSVTGAGQTIAILIDTFPADADLTAFWAANGLPNDLARIEKVNVKNGPLGPPEGEETLDVQWTSGIAPGARIRIYATGTLQFVDLDRALDAIIADTATRPDIRQLTISLGLGEAFLGGPNGETATQHQKYLRLIASGVNVFVSSGDAGSNPDNTGHNSNGPLQAEYPASDSAVTAVGGTTLRLRPDGAVAAETGWSGSGGGRSKFFARPAWQKGGRVPRGSKRLVPDVALAADPNTGAFVVLAGKVAQIGGTSWSAPVWGGICALLNEARITKGKPPLGFINPLLYSAASGVRDVVGGTNGAFKATAGYDQVTGLGVPDVRGLIAALG